MLILREESRVEAEDVPAREKSSDGDSVRNRGGHRSAAGLKKLDDTIFSTSGNDLDMR